MQGLLGDVGCKEVMVRNPIAATQKTMRFMDVQPQIPMFVPLPAVGIAWAEVGQRLRLFWVALPHRGIES